MPNSMIYWRKFVQDFFSPTGSMRQALCNHTIREFKNFEIGNAILPRYFWELIESGVHSVQFQLEGLREKELPNGQGMVVECPRAALIYTYKDAVVCYVLPYPMKILGSNVLSVFPPWKSSSNSQRDSVNRIIGIQCCKTPRIRFPFNIAANIQPT